MERGIEHRDARSLHRGLCELCFVIPTKNEVKPENLLLYAGQEAEKKQQVANGSVAASDELVYRSTSCQAPLIKLADFGWAVIDFRLRSLTSFHRGSFSDLGGSACTAATHPCRGGRIAPFLQIWHLQGRLQSCVPLCKAVVCAARAARV